MYAWGYPAAGRLGNFFGAAYAEVLVFFMSTPVKTACDKGHIPLPPHTTGHGVCISEGLLL